MQSSAPLGMKRSPVIFGGYLEFTNKMQKHIYLRNGAT